MIKIVEVGPRDGLQNEKKTLSPLVRLEFINKLSQSGLKHIEVGAFVSEKKIPQMKGSDQIAQSLSTLNNVNYLALVPNAFGMQRAIVTNIDEIAFFTATSETFSKINTNATIEESLQRCDEILQIAKNNKFKVRGYLSTCFYCPFEGKMSFKKAIHLAEKLIAMGCYEVSIADTIGAATPKEVNKLIKELKKSIPVKKLAVHFHDTRGTSLANILASLELGITTIDSSLGGLGGCPYAPGAQGNVATEDVVYMLHGMGLKTGIDLKKLIHINHWISKKLGYSLPSKVAQAKLI